MDDVADKWVSAVIGHPAHLVWLDDPTRRPVEPAYARDTDRVSFADGYPLPLPNNASLDPLNDWLPEPTRNPWPAPRKRSCSPD